MKNLKKVLLGLLLISTYSLFSQGRSQVDQAFKAKIYKVENQETVMNKFLDAEKPYVVVSEERGFSKSNSEKPLEVVEMWVALNKMKVLITSRTITLMGKTNELEITYSRKQELYRYSKGGDMEKDTQYFDSQENVVWVTTEVFRDGKLLFEHIYPSTIEEPVTYFFYMEQDTSLLVNR